MFVPSRVLPTYGVGLGGPGGPGALTDREREVAALVADGASNKGVAAALFLREKTVESHLSRVYEKLGVRSRVELARGFERIGPEARADG